MLVALTQGPRIRIMHIAYIDESKEDNKFFVYCALVIHERKWKNALRSIQAYRRKLRKSDGVYINKELHATKFCAGKGEISSKVILKGRRCEIFRETLTFLPSVDGLKLFSSVNTVEQYAFERLVNRVNRTMEARKSNAILICDEGNEAEFRKRIRRMGVYNPIPSNQGAWADTAEFTKNIPLDFIVEDPIFKKSHESYFIQMADFCAYALLRMERQLESKNRYNLHTAFPLLDAMCVKIANRKDNHGVIR